MGACHLHRPCSRSACAAPASASPVLVLHGKRVVERRCAFAGPTELAAPPSAPANPAASARRRRRTAAPPATLDALLAAGQIDQATYDARTAHDQARAARLPHAHRHAPRRARCRDRQRRLDRRGGVAHPDAPRARLPHARPEHGVVDERDAAVSGQRVTLQRQPGDLAVLPGPGHRAADARELRAGERAVVVEEARRAARAARRAGAAGRRPRRVHRVGVLLPLRRRRPAVDQLDLAGHGRAGARARGEPARRPEPERRRRAARSAPSSRPAARRRSPRHRRTARST